MKRYQFMYKYNGKDGHFEFPSESPNKATLEALERIADIEFCDPSEITDIRLVKISDANGKTHFECEGCQ
ncbi:hypothetical protein [Terribacillus saccharophilus]|uniref:hypothetical protein n=1 Tax=Terribacillus saccharophilus TaxID=361277 RepID=UPI003D2BF309